MITGRRAGKRSCASKFCWWLAAFWATTAIAWGRGGGGCLEEGTLISTPSGLVAIEKLRAGDTVWSLTAEGLRAAQVVTCYQVEPEEYISLRVGGRELQATPEHPIATGAGIFRTAEMLRPGDSVLVMENGRIQAATVNSVERLQAHRPAYNLLVWPGDTFLANGVLVHNKGCFLPDTPVLRADGSEEAIRLIKAGDAVMAFTPDGQTVTATVREVLTVQVGEYWEVTTSAQRLLRVTAEHPFYVGAGMFKTLGTLHPGDTIYAFDGQGLKPQRITSMKRVQAAALVYNLHTDYPNTFFADGIAVHNKGGGGFGGGGGFHGGGFGGGGFHGGSSGGSADDGTVFMILAGVVIIMLVVSAVQKSQEKSEDLDHLYTRGQIKGKADKTRKLLDFLAKTDETMAAAALVETATNTFTKLQECWQARAYEPMQPLLMPDLYADHSQQLAAMVRQHEIDRIENLSVEAVDIVNVRYTEKKDLREFTALISARARDYYVDDRSGAFLRGDEAVAPFQEFWTFQNWQNTWHLREVEQTKESEALTSENFFEQFTDTGLAQVYAGDAGKTGPAGPGVETSTVQKSLKTERLLNFLVQTDKLWDRQQMMQRAREVFLQVMLARESGDPARVPAAALFPDVAAHLGANIVALQQSGGTIEFRNLCVRKVEIVLVRNFADNAKDEYTARINAHAQRVTTQGGRTKQLDDYVTQFEEYWTFGRLDKVWKLKEVMLPADGAATLKAENLDEDSTPEQVQWYYNQTRAL